MIRPIFQEYVYAPTPGKRKHQEDLVGRVGHRRQRVAGEDGKRDALREKSLAELRAAKFAADQRSFGRLDDAHV